MSSDYEFPEPELDEKTLAALDALEKENAADSHSGRAPGGPSMSMLYLASCTADKMS